MEVGEEMSENKTERVTVSYDDHGYRLLNSKETIDMFGEDFLDDWGYDVEPELLDRYKEAMRNYRAVQLELRNIYHSRSRL